MAARKKTKVSKKKKIARRVVKKAARHAVKKAARRVVKKAARRVVKKKASRRRPARERTVTQKEVLELGAPKDRKKQLGKAALPASGWVIAGALALALLLSRRSFAAPPPLPKPKPSLPPAEPVTLEPDPELPQPPRVDPVTGALPGYVRHRKSSVPADVVAFAHSLVPGLSASEIGRVHYYTANDGKRWAGVIEWHADDRRGRHPGVSMFIEAGANNV